jgi:predicted RNA-binding protein with EMAP domain
MCMNEFTSSLYKEMETNIEKVSLSKVDDLQSLKNSSFIILKAMSVLKDYVANNEFMDKADEINFFKNIKPKFLSKLIYYHKAFEMLSRVPFSCLYR